MSEQLSVVLGATLTVFAIAGLGALLRRLGWLTADADQSLLRVIVRVLVPCLILSHVIGNEELKQGWTAAAAIGLGFVTFGGGMLLAWGVAVTVGRFFGLGDAVQRRTFGFVTGTFNYGYVPIPLVSLLFPDLPTLGVLLTFNVGVEIAFWTLGLLIVSGRLGWDWWRHVLTPPAIAAAVALTVNFLALDERLPQQAMAPIDMLGRAAIPLGILLVGATMADEFTREPDAMAVAGESRVKRLRLPVIAVGCLLRLLAFPVLILLLAWSLPVSADLRRVLVVQAAMPTAIFPVVLSKHYGGHVPTALRVALATSLAGLVTIPLWIAQGLSWLGLSPTGP